MGKKVKCWEVFQCKEKDCPVQESKELNCWLISGTHCRGELQGKFLEKMEMCLGCDFFTENMNVESMKDTIKVVDTQFKEYRKKVEAGQMVEEGMEMGEIVDLLGETRQKIFAPFDGVISFLRIHYSVNQGDTLLWIAKI